MYTGAVRRRLGADDDFFEAGNLQRALLCKLSVYREEEGNSSTGMMDFEEDQLRYECMFQDCGARFSSLKRHEAHYETSHRNLCSTCGCSFPTHRLLDLHLSELHDSFFKAMAERRPMYVCLVEGCPDVFESSKKRHAHLVGVHRYPKSFDFNRPPHAKKKSRIRRMKGGRADRAAAKLGLGNTNAHRKPRRGRGRPKDANDKASSTEGNGDATASGVGETESMSDGEPQGGVGRRSAANPLDCARQQPRALTLGLGSRTSVARRGNPASDGGMDLEKEVGSGTEGTMNADGLPSKAETNARPKIPRACKFWGTATGCRSGGECRFRHDAEDVTGGGLPGSEVKTGQGCGVAAPGLRPNRGSWVGNGHAEGCGGASDVDELVAGMQKLLVPNHLSFGSSARRGTPIGSVRR